MQKLLAKPHLSIITSGTDPDLEAMASRIDDKLFVDGRVELEATLCKLLAANAPATPKTLDFIGHSTAGNSLLALGDFVIDSANPTVVSFFRGLHDDGVFQRLGITAIRLLGCNTADTGPGRRTIAMLAELLGIDVFGARDLLFAAYYDAGGFAEERNYLLVGSAELERESLRFAYPEADEQGLGRILDIDGLPATPITARHAWPVRIATRMEASAVLRLVRRRAGAPMPGLLTSPHCELAFPSATDGTYHRAQVLLGGSFLRVYPDGSERPGVVFPVEDSTTLMQLVERLPLASVTDVRAAQS